MAETDPSTLPGSAKPEFPCPDCGEMVREGLVRCWNCGGFLRPEMEKQFQKMQAKPAKVIYSPLPEEDEEGPDLDAMMGGGGQSSADDGDDFQLATTVTPVVASDGEESAAAETPAAGAEGQSSSGESGEVKKTGEDAPAESDVPHSIATGGDALLELAAAEELEKHKKDAGRGPTLEGVKVIRDGFLIDAPKGCRIQVRDERTGEMRRLTFGAQSRVRISMLDKLEAIAKAKQDAAEKADKGPKHLSAGKYKRWLSDVHQHTINPAKLKLVADSLTKEFVPVELGFADDELLVVSLPVAKKGLFGAGKGAEPESGTTPRDALLQHLRDGKSLDGEKVVVAGDVKTQYTSDQIAELRAVQPAVSLSESLFAGIPVFGNGRIAVQLPVTAAGEQPKVLSFGLSQFREFLEIVAPMYSLGEFGHNLGIPLTDSFEEFKCHYTNDPVKSLEHFEYYEADSAIETSLTGYKCEACGIVVSEAAREKEKLGGKGGKGIAKAKCPKCEKKMGHVPLHTLAELATGPSMQAEDPAAAAPAEEPAATSDAAASDAGEASE